MNAKEARRRSEEEKERNLDAFDISDIIKDIVTIADSSLENNRLLEDVFLTRMQVQRLVELGYEVSCVSGDFYNIRW